MNNKPFYTFTSVPVHLFFAYSIGITVPLVKISLYRLLFKATAHQLSDCLHSVFTHDSDASRWSIPPVFSWLHKEGGLSEEEMARTFNCGLGAALVVSPVDAQRVLRQLQAYEEAWIVGSLAHKQPGAALKH